VNGEGQEAEIHIIEVKYSRPGAEILGWIVGIAHSSSVISSNDSQLQTPGSGNFLNALTLLLALIFLFCIFFMYMEVKKALEICVFAMNSIQGTAVP